jgi:diguanylate cyclase (GGDEF)-like protein
MSCSLRLSDDSVSRQHAVIEQVGESHFVCDLGSTNGTFVNEKRLSVRKLLKNGDRVRFGNQIFKYLKSDQVEAQYHEVVYKMMTMDGLTSVYNKRYFLETLDREIIQACRSASPMCVMMLDLDRFKSVNDLYGHLAGDAVLVEFAKRAKSVLRSGELLARYGGEEFAMLLTRTSLGDAVSAAERVRQITAATPVMFDGKSISVTVSIGVHCFDGQNDCTSGDLIAAADELLYRAKEQGRNQVQFLALS